MIKHIEGPWLLKRVGRLRLLVVDPRTDEPIALIARPEPPNDEWDAVAEANAMLVTSAPDLKDALDHVAKTLLSITLAARTSDERTLIDSIIPLFRPNAIRSALAKVQGEGL